MKSQRAGSVESDEAGHRVQPISVVCGISQNCFRASARCSQVDRVPLQQDWWPLIRDTFLCAIQHIQFSALYIDFDDGDRWSPEAIPFVVHRGCLDLYSA